MKLRAATAADIPALHHIALSAKAHWPYTAEQLDRWSAELRVSPESIHAQPTLLAEIEGKPVGFTQLDPDVSPWQLVALWVLPDYMRQGIGKTLLTEALALARDSAQSCIAIDSDPHAEGFYAACSAVKVGQIPAPIPGNPERMRPQLVLSTGAA
jgi:GNAT superfamily N-acetyltransferase